MTVTLAQLDIALEALSELANASDPSLEGFVIAKSGEGTILTEVPLDQELTGEFEEAAATKARTLCDLSPLPYSPSVARSDGHYLYVETGVGALANFESELSDADASLFDPHEEYAQSLRFFVIKVTLRSDTVVSLYRVLRPTAWMSKSKGIAAFWSDGRFKKMAAEGMILFDRNFDTVVAQGVAFFTAKQTFERTFDYMEEMKKGAQKAFTKITAKLRIDGIEEMHKACTSDPNMMSKMSSVQRRMDADENYAQAMTMERLTKFVDEHPHYEVEISGTGSEARLVYHNDPRRRYKILHLLDDDYLRSALTENDYEANSKSDALR